ncbi:DUF1109 domain-containing protein [Sphingomonas sp. CGMCC 1.13654]|uniref:DUF1109 domain-containing protein n=1 Tax=Sphingomonas chungangi TaxID=2683589 RepID=A0A838LBE9_9SPHN|nr:DUF1109 domain-containing protein [Sphingomonas chungangi]MBA2936544.1 DUF1109 domain-containing protein [Sphingomonas chungangi]MVW55929.1 DUF1109 family protein [Sphingomonas chungangi]
MNTDTLIDQLAGDVPRVPRRARLYRLGGGIVAGAIVTLMAVTLGLGVRPDLAIAMHGFAFWMKWIYTISLGIGSLAVTAQLARPEAPRLRRFWPLVIPFLLLGAVGAVEMAHVPTADWLAMWLGKSWKICPWLVLVLAAPIFVGLLWSFRRLAPTRLRAAGAAAGFTAAAWAATLYCLHCPEVSAMFVLTWYTLGMMLAACVGALCGPRLLRW